MSAVYQPVLTLVGTAHGRLSTKGRARPSRAGLDGRRERRLSLLSLRAKRQWPSSMMEGGGTMEFKQYEVPANGISLYVTELGEGPVVLFCHGFPDTSYTWRQQMKAVASAGSRAIAPDMRGYGRSSATSDATLYTPVHTASDLLALLDAMNIARLVIGVHFCGATHSWNAAMM